MLCLKATWPDITSLDDLPPMVIDHGASSRLERLGVELVDCDVSAEFFGGRSPWKDMPAMRPSLGAARDQLLNKLKLDVFPVLFLPVDLIKNGFPEAMRLNYGTLARAHMCPKGMHPVSLRTNSLLGFIKSFERRIRTTYGHRPSFLDGHVALLSPRTWPPAFCHKSKARVADGHSTTAPPFTSWIYADPIAH